MMRDAKLQNMRERQIQRIVISRTFSLASRKIID
jgi:hypothetical protein